jgi:cytosine/adenosine deaminase-related metal-dependent hydrolase
MFLSFSGATRCRGLRQSAGAERAARIAELGGRRCSANSRAATLDNATALGLSQELGSSKVGKRGDLLLLKDNPLANVSAYDSIETIFLDGEPIARKALRTQN